jgi:hypothetical protein
VAAPNKHVARYVALAQARASEPVLGAGIVHRHGFARRSVAYLVAIGAVFGLGGALGGLVLVVLGALILFAMRAAYGALRDKPEPSTPAVVALPPHVLVAVTNSRVVAFAARQKQAWFRGGWGTAGWELGDEIGSWDRSAVSTEARKGFISWKLIVKLPDAEPLTLEAQAYGARASSEPLVRLLTS